MLLRLEDAAPRIGAAFLACLALISSSCNEAPSPADSSGAPRSQDVGFEAVITGSYSGQVSGRGVLVLLPEAGFENQGYFFLSDGQGIRPHGVTFVLPRDLSVGKHTLQSSSPLDIGTVPSVRVDRDTRDSVLSSEINTSGFLDLLAFPDSEDRLSGSDVVGSFEFETEDLKAQRIRARGKFAFRVE